MIIAIIKILSFLSSVIGIFYFNKWLYAAIGAFCTRTYPKATTLHKYAVLIAARNEEAVIADLIESIRSQDYPQELVDIFVVADNCTDKTAEIATKGGAVCYERSDAKNKSKGYALQFLVERIRRDFGIENYEGYFIFDADNLLKSDYISRMNEAFDAGEKIITSYRNTKNFSTNWISASYGIHWLRTCRMEHRGRSMLKLACRVQGTGYLLSSELLQEGWNYTCLTEDRAFCADAVVRGYRIAYQHEAQFYDEQPDDLKTALRQRLRWAKGNLTVTKLTGAKLLYQAFCRKGIQKRILSIDMLTIVYPRGMMLLLKKLIIYILQITAIAFSAKIYNIGREIWGITSLGLVAVLHIYGQRVITAAYILWAERSRVGKLQARKTIWYCLTFPLFDTIGKFCCLAALFMPVEWKSIAHKVSVSAEKISIGK